MSYRNAALPVAERVADLLTRMTIDEKIFQLFQTFITDENREEVKQQIRATGLGSRILAASNLAGNMMLRMAELDDLNEIQRIAVEESRLGIPILHGRDVIHGHRTVFPIPLAMAATFDPAAMEEAFRIAAQEARAAGVHWSFAPMMDIARDPRWGRIIEGFGEDPYLGARMAEAAVYGFQGDHNEDGYWPSDRILACAKHYVGYGAAEGGRDYNTAEISDHTLRNIYLPPFKAAVKAGVGSVMSAFHDLNGESASGSRYLLTDILRGEFGFDGFVVSDWGSVDDLIHHRVAADERDAARIAFDAGVDMEMVSLCYIHHLAELIQAGEISHQQLDDACGRVLAAKFSLGLFENPYVERPNPVNLQMPAENLQASRRTAARGMVLLENNGLLPLSKETRRIAVIGPYADQRRAMLGSWVNDGLTDETATLVEAMCAACPQAEILTAPIGLYDEMLMAAAGADVVILAVGESNARNGENNHVAVLHLPAGQDELVRAVGKIGKPTVLVVFSGRPLVLTDLVGSVDAVLWAWHPGSAGAYAAADVLFGDINPGGKLPVSFPRAGGQIPVHYNANSTGKGGSDYLDLPGKPLYPFGFGLSYTTFEISDLRLSQDQFKAGETVNVSVQVQNSGQRAGDEIVQCYIQDCVSHLTRPVRELKGFRRVTLQPGESRRVEFALGPDELSYYGPSGKWLLEPGVFKVWLGNDSRAALEGSFTVTP
ncbi:MAG: glycoside hydrolase family 3 N-terminal domain-containing protein [Bellilinea sp.]